MQDVFLVDEKSFQTDESTGTAINVDDSTQAELLAMPLLLSSYSVELKKAQSDLEPLPMGSMSEQRAFRASFVARLSSIDWEGEYEDES